MLLREEMQTVRSRSVSDLSMASNLIMKSYTPHMSRRRGYERSRSWNRRIQEKYRIRAPRIRSTTNPQTTTEISIHPGEISEEREFQYIDTINVQTMQ